MLQHLKGPSPQRKIITSALILLLFISISYLIYSPVTRGHYLYGEDYIRLWTSDHPQVSKQSYVSYAHSIQNDGRPLVTLYYYLAFNKYINVVKSFDAINTVRLIGILGVGLLAFILFLFFRENKFRTEHAFLLSILICTLPPIQQYIGRLIIIVLLYSVLLSALSSLILFKYALNVEPVKKGQFITAVISASVLFIISLCIYQPTATTFWAMAVIPLITIRDEDVLKRKRVYFTVFGTGFASLIAYYVIVKISDWYMGLEIVQRGSFIWITDIFPKIIWFIRYPFYDALNLWNINHSIEAGLIVGIIILAGILFHARQILLRNGGNKETVLSSNVLLKYLLIFTLIPLSFLSHLVVKGQPGPGALIPFHRTLIGLEIIIVMLFYMGLMNIVIYLKNKLSFSTETKMRILTIALALIALVTSVVANHNIDLYFATHNSDEYKYVKDAILEYGVSELPKVSKIYFIGAKWNTDLSMNYGEFYNRNTVGRFGAIPVVSLILYELGIDSYIPIELITYDDSIGKQLPDNKNVLIIDMRKTDFLDEKFSVS